MSTTAATTPPSAAPAFNHVCYDAATNKAQLPKLQTGDALTSTSYTSSPESRSVDLRSPIPEEEEDDTSSEAANEPVTPTDNHRPQSFQPSMNGAMKQGHDTFAAIPAQQQTPLIVNTNATPPPLTPNKIPSTPVAEQKAKAPAPKRPGSASKDEHTKRGLSGFFRRSNSHGANAHHVVPMSIVDNAVGACATSSDTMLGKEQRKTSIRRMSANNSPYTTRSNSPPSPRSPVESDRKDAGQQLQVQEPDKDELFHNRKKNRSSTGLGFGLRDRLHKHTKHTPLHSHEKELKNEHNLHRATSVDLDSAAQAQGYAPCNQDAKLPERAVWALPAETGIGLKSRRMSLSLPDDFTVDVADLYAEFQDQSKMVGKRGKSIGKGATSKVKLMNRKGYSSEVYAVKEFRGKSTAEREEDYEQKVKSEFSIAKSVHHPNIVETFRLCVHHGKWNHVMEYCEQGDLFSLVSQKYLSKPDRLNDRLCLFKQMVQGIHYLHSNGIAHRDIKLENILITKDSKVKITDFGVSEVFSGLHPGLRSAGGQCGKAMKEVRLCAPGMCGSAPYVAPEVLAKYGEYDPRPLDVWGAAVVMLTLCANGCLWTEARVGVSPLYDDLVRGWTKWNAKHADGSVVGITETDYPHVAFFDQHINPPALRRALLTMLNPDPSKRAPIEAIAKNRWVKNIECCQIDSYDDPTTIIDASRIKSCAKITKVVSHNHLPPHHSLGHKLVRLPGSTEMY